MRVELVALISIILLTGPQLTTPYPTPGSRAVEVAVPSSTPTSSVTQPVASAAASIITTAQPNSSGGTPDVSAPTIQAGPVPVLMYHELGDGPNELYLAVADFTAQLDYLQAEGYHAVTLRQLYDHRMDGQPLPEKPIVLTFDDGYLSVYTDAFPRLCERGMTATLFVESGHVGWYNRLDWEHLRELAEAGFEIGSHTQTHPGLTFLAESQLLDEIRGSKSTLEETLDISVDSFCYPAGQYDAVVLANVEEAGYLAAVTTQYGMVAAGDNPYLWPRVRISRSDQVDGFRHKLDLNP